MPYLDTRSLIGLYGQPDEFADDPSTIPNRIKAGHADAALTAYDTARVNRYMIDVLDRRGDNYAVNTEDFEQATDLVADVFHWVILGGGDPEELMTSAWRHFTAEVGLGYDVPES